MTGTCGPMPCRGWRCRRPSCGGSRSTHTTVALISSVDLLDFEIDGRQFRLMDAQRGIRKPRELSAALSIRTVYTPDGQQRPYEDSLGSDGLLRYKWRGDNADHAENRALRAAMEGRLPLIWFFGVGPGVYEPIYPAYLLWEEPDQHQFVIDPAHDHPRCSRNSRHPVPRSFVGFISGRSAAVCLDPLHSGWCTRSRSADRHREGIR